MIRHRNRYWTLDAMIKNVTLSVPRNRDCFLEVIKGVYFALFIISASFLHVA